MSTTNGIHPEEVQGGDAIYKFPTGPMVLGEAPIFRKSDSTLHLVDCIKEPCELHILKLDEKTGDVIGEPTVHKLEDSVTVQFFRKNKPGSYIAAYFAGVAFMDEKTGKLEIVKEIIPQEERSIRRFNDGGIDVKGRFWLAEIDRKALACGPHDKESLEKYGKPIGRLWRYDPDGSLHLMEDGLACGNGLAWSPDHKTFYLNDSCAMVIYAYDFDAETGNISNKRLFIDRRDNYGEPDGMVADTEGNLWIAVWGTWSVCKYSPKGELLKVIKFPARNMACTTWGGPNNDWLYIASASDRTGKALPGDQGGHLFRYKVEGGVQGMPKYEFDG